jgi:hypothetical protein
MIMDYKKHNMNNTLKWLITKGQQEHGKGKKEGKQTSKTNKRITESTAKESTTLCTNPAG